MKLDSAATSSLEDRVKRKIYSIQRTPASLDNFMKRWRHSSFALTEQTDMAKRECTIHPSPIYIGIRNKANIFWWRGIYKLNLYDFEHGICIFAIIIMLTVMVCFSALHSK